MGTNMNLQQNVMLQPNQQNAMNQMMQQQSSMNMQQMAMSQMTQQPSSMNMGQVQSINSMQNMPIVPLNQNVDLENINEQKELIADEPGGIANNITNDATPIQPNHNRNETQNDFPMLPE